MHVKRVLCERETFCVGEARTQGGRRAPQCFVFGFSLSRMGLAGGRELTSALCVQMTISLSLPALLGQPSIGLDVRIEANIQFGFKVI